MSSTYPIAKSVKWRMKDWVSCFNVCRLPKADEEKEAHMSISSPFPQVTSVRNRSREDDYLRRKYLERQRAIESTSHEEIKETGIQVSPAEKGQSKNSSTNSHMSEEEYIEFCFKNNGEIHEIEQMKSSQQIQSKFVNGKEEDDQWQSDQINERVYKHFVEETNNEAQQEEGNILESRSASNMSSDGSVASFTFPILSGSSSLEWMGRPGPIPQPEDAAALTTNAIENQSHLHSSRF